MLKQDLSSDEYEIICVNDGSTDGSLNVLSEYSQKNKNIRVIDKGNSGVSSARNDGIEAARGEYIWFVDGDDFIQPNCLAKVVSFLRDNKYQIVKFQHAKVEENARFIESDSSDIVKINRKSVMIGPCVWHMIVRRELLIENGIAFREDMAYCEDALFQYYVWLNANQEKCAEIQNVLYYYRKRSSSASRIIDANKITKQVCSFMQIASIYQGEARVLTNKKHKKATRQRQYLAILNGLTYLPESTLDVNKTIKKLKEENLYPIPILWRHIFQSRGVKAKAREFVRNLFRFKFVYLSYCRLAKKKQIIKRHKESI